jgi:hypothetical protein
MMISFKKMEPKKRSLLLIFMSIILFSYGVYMIHDMYFKEDFNEYGMDISNSIYDYIDNYPVPDTVEFIDTSSITENIAKPSGRDSINYNHGIYNYHGVVFFDDYFNITTRETYMSITPQIDPTNGVPEVWIVPKMIDETKFVVEIFVDSDFVEELRGDINIIYGPNYDYIKKFELNEYLPGIYKDYIVESDTRRFEFDYNGVDANILVSNATLEHVRDRDTNSITGVFMK